MTNVRIRHELNAEGALLGDVPFFDTENVIDHLKRWGVRDDQGSVDVDFLSGEFVIDGSRAYFEVMIGLSE